MTKFLFYLHKRLFVQQYGRAEIMNILARKTLKSIARSTGARISSNRWLKTLEFLYRSTGPTNEHIPESLAEFKTNFKLALQKYQRTHATSIQRTLFVMDYLDAKADNNMQPFLLACADHKQAFIERDDEFWFAEAIARMEYVPADCGHYVDTDQVSWARGTQENFQAQTSLCNHCREEALRTGLRVNANDGLILAEFTVEVRTPYGTSTCDRRNPALLYNERYQCWHTRDWTPYSDLIENYHSSNARGFKVIESPWFKRHRRAYGIELEVQNRNAGSTQAAAGKVHDALNPSGNKGEYCFFERDGSIGEGFELITQPAGLDVHRYKLALFLNDEDMKRGLRSHEGGSCGLHVHVGREYVTQAQIYRIQSFLNDVRNEGLIKKVSRRYNNSYARIKPEMAKLSPLNKHSSERYEALNVTNRNTIEFRIFRGSLKYESVMAALEFVDALLTFCMPGQVSIMDFNAIGFRKFITRHEHAPDTKFLRNYLQLNQQNDAEHRLAA